MSELHNGWKTYRFDQMAQIISERVDPAEADTDIYVGLEHLDPEVLHIKRWGHPSDVEGQKLRFYPGDIIFGRRRFYQRKLAVAEFEGICSAHAMVIRANPEVVLPEFLPFFMQSDMFYERMMRISTGSLSPTINQAPLKRQQFALPPLDEQRRIAEILWAADEAVELYERAVREIHRLERGVVSRRIFSNGYPLVRLGDVTEQPEYGINAPAIDYQVGLPRFVRITDIDEFGNLSDELVAVDVDQRHRYLLAEGDLLFARTGATVGKTYLYDPQDGPCVFAGYLIRFRPKPALVRPHYLFFLTKSREYDLWVKNTVRVGAQPNINATEYANLPVPLTNLAEQQHTVDILLELKARAHLCQSHIQELRHLVTRIMNEILNRSF